MSLRKRSRSEREQSGRDGIWSELYLLVEKLLVDDGWDVEERVSHSQEDSIEIRGRHRCCEGKRFRSGKRDNFFKWGSDSGESARLFIFVKTPKTARSLNLKTINAAQSRLLNMIFQKLQKPDPVEPIKWGSDSGESARLFIFVKTPKTARSLNLKTINAAQSRLLNMIFQKLQKPDPVEPIKLPTIRNNRPDSKLS